MVKYFNATFVFLVLISYIHLFKVFHSVAYKARTRMDLLAGVDEFLDATTVLPPGVWDPATRIEPPLYTASQVSNIIL